MTRGPEPRARREASGRPCRGPPARIWRLRGHDPEGRVWRRHRDRLGSRHAGRRSAIAHKGYAKGPSRIRAPRREARTAAGISSAWHGKPREKRENWLLIKGDDEAARTEGDPDILEERPESVKTGRDHRRRRRRGAGLVVEDRQDHEDGKTARKPKRAAKRRRSPERPAQVEGRQGKAAAAGLRRAGAGDACQQGRQPASAGCTRSSSTATACRRGSRPGG